MLNRWVLATFVMMLLGATPVAAGELSKACLSGLTDTLKSQYPGGIPALGGTALAPFVISTPGPFSVDPAESDPMGGFGGAGGLGEYTGEEASILAMIDPPKPSSSTLFIIVSEASLVDRLAEQGFSASAGSLGTCSPFLVGYLSTVLSHEARHSTGLCGSEGDGELQPGEAADECTHLALALEGAKAACDLAGKLKACVDGAGPPPLEGSCPNIEPEVPLGEAGGRLEGMCAELKSQQDELFKPPGQQEKFKACACGQAPYNAPATCTQIEPPGGGCSATPPYGAGYPLPDCSVCPP